METMLRRLSLLLALLIALAGCAAAEEVPNPRVEMADASELEAALGFPVNAPEGVDAVYTVIGGSTGEAAFDVGDIACTLRAARTQETDLIRDAVRSAALTCYAVERVSLGCGISARELRPVL